MTKKHSKTFDRQKWAAETEEKLSSARTALNEGLRSLVTGDDWQHQLEAMAVLGPLSVARFSFGNQILIAGNHPTAYAATFQSWKEAGRSVRKGEKGIIIRKPSFAPRNSGSDEQEDGPPRLVGFRALHVFALDQTDGPELATPPVPDVVGLEAFPNSVERLRRCALGITGFPVTAVTLRERRLDAGEAGVNGWYDRDTREIVVITTGRERPAIFRTLVHELTHALLHGADDHHSRPEREVEAESTAFIVCHALGLHTGDYSFPYVATWAAGTDSDDPLKAVERSGDRIAKAAQTILNALMPAAAEDAASFDQAA